MSSELVALPNGPIVPAEVVELGCRLENQGYQLIRQGDKLLVRNKNATSATPLSNEDREAVRKWRDHLLLVVDYNPTTT